MYDFRISRMLTVKRGDGNSPLAHDNWLLSRLVTTVVLKSNVVDLQQLDKLTEGKMLLGKFLERWWEIDNLIVEQTDSG